MNLIKKSQASYHKYDDTVRVTEFNFPGDATINDAETTLTGRYPAKGYAVNDISTALVSVESGSGSITLKNNGLLQLEVGDRIIVKPGEPYFFMPADKLVIRYIATPAWTPDQARVIQ